MTIKNGILKDRNSDNRIYLIDLESGIKAEVFFYSLEKNEIMLLRDTISNNDIARASSNVDLSKFKDVENDNQTIIKSLNKMSIMIKEGLLSNEYPKNLHIEFHVGNEKFVI